MWTVQVSPGWETMSEIFPNLHDVSHHAQRVSQPKRQEAASTGADYSDMNSGASPPTEAGGSARRQSAPIRPDPDLVFICCLMLDPRQLIPFSVVTDAR